MSLAVAIPCAVLAAVAYGASTAVQHRQVHRPDQRADARGLLLLLRNPVWLMSMVGDGVGLALQVAALLTGPVVLVQPLLVLAVPISLPIGWALGGQRPSRGDVVASVGIVLALAVFSAVVGVPGPATETPPAIMLLVAASLVGLGLVALGAVRGRRAAVRAAVFGAVAGAAFGLVGVLLDAVSVTWQASGWETFTAAPGLVPLLGLAVVGAFAIVLTQVSFQVGALSASFPANEAAAPVVGVVLGAWLLSEEIPWSAPAAAAYALCFAVMLAGTVWLARGWDTAR